MTGRRVVTGLGADGRTRFVDDGPAPHVTRDPRAPGFENVALWATDGVVTVPGDGADPTRPDQKLFPGPDGSRFFVNVFPPGFGTGETGPYLHASKTVDYGVVLSGELTLVLDTGEETTLRATDTVVQNGTRHGWCNRGDVPAVAAFVVLGAREVR